MKRLYLAGPMKGKKDHNYPLFYAEAAHLRLLRYDIVNPAEINKGADKAFLGLNVLQTARLWAKCMKADIAALMTCEGIALLPGWKASTGASIEYYLARDLHMEVPLAAELQVKPLEV